MTTSPTLTLTQAAYAASSSERTILRAIHGGDLPARKENGRLAIEAEDLQLWLATVRADDRRCSPSGRLRERALLSLLEEVTVTSAELLAQVQMGGG